MSPYAGERKQIIALRVGEVAAMVALDEFWPKSVGVIRSVTIEIVTAIFAFASLSSLLVALQVSVVCTRLTASDLWQIIVSVAAVPAILKSAVIAFRMRRSLEQVKMTHAELVNLARIDGLTELPTRVRRRRDRGLCGNPALRRADLRAPVPYRCLSRPQ